MRPETNEDKIAEILNTLKSNGIQDIIAYKLLLGMALDPDEDIVEAISERIQPILKYNRFFTSPFSKPTNEVDGKIRFAISENGKPVGINPEECHFLIAGQTGSGKSTLLKIIFMQALLLNEE